MSSNYYAMTLEEGAFTTAPIYSSHRRSKNWFAIISKNPKSPNGLDREFLDRGKGQYHYIDDVDLLKINTPVECAADQYSSSGRKSPDRRYCVLIARYAHKVVLQKCETINDCFKLVKEFTDNATTLVDAEKAYCEHRLGVLSEKKVERELDVYEILDEKTLTARLSELSDTCNEQTKLTDLIALRDKLTAQMTQTQEEINALS